MKKPTLFGKYLLLERINVGGMAEVFIAKAFGVEGFERILAIKKILPTMAEDEEFITMFIDEARISVQLNHANIVHIHELGKHDDTYFIAMEYVAGRDVRTILERYRRRKEIMPTAQAVFVASKMCDGLDYAHRKKDARGQDLHIIHRDISPQNILISYEGEVKVIDFGIAKAANRSQKTQAGILKGKFGYMSPEQVRGMPIDRRSDIFAVGVLLYEMLTGEKLFVGESDFSTLEKVRNADVPLPREFNPNIPPGLEKVVLKALAREPEERYQWASDLAEDLMRFLLAGDAIYSSKHLSSYMKEAFAEDMLREAEKMERYASIERPDQIETSGVTVPPPSAPQRSGSQSQKRVPPPAVVVTGTPAGRAPTSPAQPAPGYIPPPSDEELAEMDGGGADKTQIVDSTQTFRAPETRIADSSVVVDDSITGRSENPIQGGGTASAFPAPGESSARKGKSGPKAQVVISNEEGEAYAGATMIGPAPTAPPSRSRPAPPPPEDEATGDIPLPVSSKSSRAPARAPQPRAEPEPVAYDDPQDYEGAGRDDYGDEDPPTYDESQEPPEEEVTGSLPSAPVAKKGAKAAPPPAKVKAKAPPPAKKGKPTGGKQLPKPVLFAAAAGIVLLLVVIAAVALSPPSAGEVTFMVSPSQGARIEVNGKQVELNTLLSLPPGQYRVVASAPGHQSREQLVEVVAGKQTPVSLALKPAGEAPAEPSEPPANPDGSGTAAAGNPEQGGTAQAAVKNPENPTPAGAEGTDTGTGDTAKPVAKNPTPETPPAPRKVAAIFEGRDGAEIFVNGTRLGRTPDARAADLEVGKKYKFTAKLAGYKTYAGEFTADGRDEEMTVAFDLTKEPEREPVREPVREPRTPKPPPTQVVTKPKPGKVMGKFACSTKPAGADILVDGKKTGRQTPVPLSAPLMLPVGNRKVSFRLNGKTTKPVVVAITEDGVAKLLNVPIE
ncbi:protein kinase [Myxococcus sp. RHSTA-1-4]|uniref:protein kinase domain-containing protein n=1 Tax=Myxococcus sp. RHSTA-1-4 TaxID=2874601 RepID=UPI001CBF5F05|nr:protein kinase [Myxococcus sp. RHSTA-1-4]MBZ4417666.1 protein kinase [Myxococcus sp. RHSTA-1-4]